MTNVNNVALGKPRIGGAIFRAPLGTDLPTDASTELGPEFIQQGYVSGDGVERAISKSYESITAWGGDEVDSTKTEENIRLNFSLLESGNVEVLKSAFGENAVTEEDGLITLAYTGEEPEDSIWVVDMAYKGKLRRVIFPHAANVTEDFTQSFVDDAPIEIPFSLAARRTDGGFFRDFIEGGDSGGDDSGN